MALILFLMMTGLIGVWIYRLVNNPKLREIEVSRFKQKPSHSLFVLAWISSIYVFIIGIFVPPFGEIEVHESGLHLWQLGGMSSLLGFAIHIVWKQ